MDLTYVPLLLANGLLWGLLMALISLGLSLMFGLTGIMNVAHGEMYMWGAFFACLVVDESGSFWSALALAPPVGALVGFVIERFVLRKVRNRTTQSLIVTFGLAMVLQHAALLAFGGAPRRLAPPDLLAGTVALGKLGYPVYRLFVAALSACVLLGVELFVHRTRFGVWMRAVRHDQQLAMSLGVPVKAVYVATVVMASALAAFAGALAAPIMAVEFRMGLEILPFAFLAVILGGMGDIRGPVVAAIALSLTEGLLTAFVSPTVSRVLTLLAATFAVFAFPDGMKALVRRSDFGSLGGPANVR